MTAPRSYVYKIPMEKSNSAKSPSKSSARNKMMDLLARREHTEKELRLKLEDSFPRAEIEEAIEFGKKSKWIANSDETLAALAEKTAEDLRRRGKGTLFINSYLEEKGLPKVSVNDSEELEKARRLVENKFSGFNSLDSEEKAPLNAKVGRFLISRGFDEEIVRKVVYGEE